MNMKRRELILKSIVLIAITVVWLSAAPVKADLLFTTDDGLSAYQLGKTLPNSPNYDWWYGCSPTSAGMLMGYYDLNGYDGGSGLELYPNLVPGGDAELSNFGDSDAIANDAIASAGHIADFWTGYGNSGDDPLASGRTIPSGFNSLADFMGTSQDGMSVPTFGSWDNSDGGTTFWYNGSNRVYASDIAFWDATIYPGILESSGMYGLWEYEQYALYGSGTPASQNIFNQYVDTQVSGGFSFSDYIAEIEAGRPVLIHTENHTMFGYGYDGTDTVYLYDTWDPAGQNPGEMVWGGIYGGKFHIGVTVFEPTGGVPVPVPAAVLLGMLGLGVVGIKLRRFA